MAKVEMTVTMKDFDKVKELFEAASLVLPDIAEIPKRDRLARALTAFSVSDDMDSECAWCQIATNNLRRASGDLTVVTTCTEHGVSP